MKDDQLGSEYLHPYFWYKGMNKIKAGKGYRNDIPLGVLSGPCQECEGTVISIKMNTSARGMECTSEKVCNKCGLVHDGAFIVLGKIEKDYHTRPFSTHEEWLERMKELDTMMGNSDDIAVECEMFEHATGRRPGDDTEINISGHGTFKEIAYGNGEINSKKLAKALKLNNWKSEHWNRPDNKEWKKQQYYNYIDICKSLLMMNRLQVERVRYIVDNVPNILNIQRYNAEDIISHICLVVMKESMKPQTFSVMIREYKRYNRYNKTLYSTVASLLNKQ